MDNRTHPATATKSNSDIKRIINSAISIETSYVICCCSTIGSKITTHYDFSIVLYCQSIDRSTSKTTTIKSSSDIKRIINSAISIETDNIIYR
jgi:hypothetical protein